MKLFKPEAKKREMVSIEPTAFFALQDLIKKYGTDLKGLYPN
jgi:hypothetical protein